MSSRTISIKAFRFMNLGTKEGGVFIRAPLALHLEEGLK